MNNRKIVNNKYIKDDILASDVFLAMIGVANNTMSLCLGMGNLLKENAKLKVINPDNIKDNKW